MPYFNWAGIVKKTKQRKTFQSYNVDFETVEEFESVAKIGHPGIEYVPGSGEIVDDRAAVSLPMPAGAGEHGIKAAILAGQPVPVASAPQATPAPTEPANPA